MQVALHAFKHARLCATRTLDRIDYAAGDRPQGIMCVICDIQMAGLQAAKAAETELDEYATSGRVQYLVEDLKDQSIRWHIYRTETCNHKERSLLT